MIHDEDEKIKMTRAVREILLEATEEELRDALAEAGQDLASLASRGRAAAERALGGRCDETAQILGLHRGLGSLVHMLRRRAKLSVEELAARARIDVSELRGIELDPSIDPNPRTMYQLEEYFDLPARSLIILSGAVQVANDVREEAVRFAASSQGISNLSREEKRLLNRFVRFLEEYTDR
jgi:transcriptional regulator with XRE-family HTH domain